MIYPRGRSHPVADRLVVRRADTAPPHLSCPFVPKKLPTSLHEDESIQFLIDEVYNGSLSSWMLGTQGGHIASRFVTVDGVEDILTSYKADDDDYAALAAVHIKRLKQLVQPPELGGDEE